MCVSNKLFLKEQNLGQITDSIVSFFSLPGFVHYLTRQFLVNNCAALESLSIDL